MMIKQDSYLELQHNKTLKILFFILFGAVIAGLIIVFRFFFWPFLFALMLYMALRPVYEYILRLIKNRGLSSGIMIIFLFVLFLVPLLFLIIAVIEQVRELYLIIQKQIKAGIIDEIYHNEIVQLITEYLDLNKAEIVGKITEIVQRFSGMLLSSVQAIIAYPLNFLLNFLFLLLMLFFLFKDGNRLGAFFYKLLPFPEDMEASVIDRLREVTRVLLTGNILIMILQGAIVGLGLCIVNLPVALLGGSLAAILSLIPVIGTSLVWVPAVLYLVIVGSYLKALFVGIWCLGFYLLLENIVKPKIFGKKLNFHPVIFFFLLLGSLQAFSLPGIFIGPLLLTLFYSLWEIYKMLKDFDIPKPEPSSPKLKPRKSRARK